MKAPKKSINKPAVKGKGTDDSKKPKLKPLNPKEYKNWKNKLDEDADDEEEIILNEDELEETGSRHAFEDNFDEEDERY